MGSSLFLKPFPITLLNKHRQRRFPWFLFVVCQLAQRLGVHSQSFGHADVLAGETVTLARFLPEGVFRNQLRCIGARHVLYDITCQSSISYLAYAVEFEQRW